MLMQKTVTDLKSRSVAGDVPQGVQVRPHLKPSMRMSRTKNITAMKFLLHVQVGENCSCWWKGSKVNPSSPAHFQSSSTFSYWAWGFRASHLLEVTSVFFHSVYSAHCTVRLQGCGQVASLTGERGLVRALPCFLLRAGTCSVSSRPRCLAPQEPAALSFSCLWLLYLLLYPCCSGITTKPLCAGTGDLSFK